MKLKAKILTLVLVLATLVSMIGIFAIPASAANTAGTTLYLKPNSNWTQANARFAAYFMNSSKSTTKWVDMKDSDGDGYYEVTIPSGSWTYVIFCRMSPSATANNWDNKWNQTGDLTIPTDSKNCFTLASGNWDGATTTWSKYTPTACKKDYDAYGKCTNTACKTCHFYTVTGSDANVFGSSWKPETGKKMLYNSSTSTYTLTVEGVAAGEYKFKCIKDGDANWSGAVGGTGSNADTDGNFVLNVEKNNSTITINLKSGVVSASAVHVHIEDAGTVTTQPGCESTGVKTFKCSVSGCTDTIRTETVAATGHSWVDADCDTPKTCSVCGGTEGEALGHNYVDGSCTVCRGADPDYCAHEYTYDCDKACNKCFNKTRPDAEHNTSHTEAKDATCTENGNVEYWSCSICGSAWTDEALTKVTNLNSVVIPAGHDWVDADCDTPKTCSACSTTEGEALGHTPGAEATCTTAQTCTVCTEVLVAALGHNFVDGVCTGCNNVKVYLYTISGNDRWDKENARFAVYYFNNETNGWVDMTGENGVYSALVPYGCSIIFCRMDGATTDNGWNTKWNQTVDITDGKTCYKLDALWGAEGTEGKATVKGDEHSYSGWSSVDTDNHSRTCSICGKVEYAEHTHDNACDTTCNVCSATREVGDHVPNDDDGDCTTDIVCSVCGAVTTEGNENHSYGGWTNNGDNHKHICGNIGCNAFETEAHSFEHYAYNNDAKCGVDGTKTAQCVSCIATDTITADGTALEHLHTSKDFYRVDNEVLNLVDPCDREGCDYEKKTAIEAGTVVAINNEADLNTVLGAGYSVKLTADIELSKGIYLNNIGGDKITLTINLDGYDIKNENGGVLKNDGSGYYNVDVLVVSGNYDITINAYGNNDLGSMISGKLDEIQENHIYAVLSALDGAHVTINNGMYISNYIGDVIYATRKGVVNIHGGTFEAKAAYGGVYYVLDVNENEPADNRGVINVYGGGFVNFNPANHTNDRDYTNKLADGYHAIKSGNTWMVGAHSYKSTVTAPTCTTAGYSTHTCSCGHSYIDSEVAELGHKYNAVVTAPDCENDGYTTYTCSVCDDTYVDDEVDALGHSYNAVVTAPTFDAQGYTTHTCANCDDSYVDSYVPALVAVAQVGDAKYASVIEALLAAVENGSSEVKIIKSVREKMPTDIELVVNADLHITADEAVEVKFYNEGTSYDFIFNSNNNNTITIGENVTFQLEDRVIWLGYYGNNVTVVVNGTLAGYQIWHGADTTVNATGAIKSTGEAFVMRRGATLKVDGGKIEANYFNILAGNIFAENATITCGAFWIDNNGGYQNEGYVNINIWDSKLISSGNLKSSSSNEDGVSIDFYNSVVQFNDYDGYGASQLDANTSLDVDGENSELTVKSLVNNGTINVYDGATIISTATVANNNYVEITDSTVLLKKLDNDNLMFLNGSVTIKVEDATGSSYAIRANDGIVFNDSYIIGTVNETVRLLGSATFNGGFQCAYLQGSSNGVGGTVTIEDGTVVKATYGVDFGIDYVLNGGKIELSGGNKSGEIWGMVFQSGNFVINSDLEVVGNKGAYAPIHFTDATATVNGNINHSISGGEPIYVGKSSNVTFAEGSVITTDCSVHVNGNLNGAGSVNGKITKAAETANIIISGGTYTQDVSEWCADGFDCKNNGDGTFGVIAHVHSYGEKVTAPTCTEEGYTTYTCACGDSYVDDTVAALNHIHDSKDFYRVDSDILYLVDPCDREGCDYEKKTAIEAGTVVDIDNDADLHTVLGAGYNVKLTANIDLSKAIHLTTTGHDITIDMNGKTLTNNGKLDGNVVEVIWVEGDLKVTITGNGTMKSFYDYVDENDETIICVVSATDGAHVVIDNGTYYSAGCTTVAATRASLVEIKGGHYSAADTSYLIDVDERDGYSEKIVITGGQFEGFNPANHSNDGTDSNKVAEGYCATVSLGTWSVGVHSDTNNDHKCERQCGTAIGEHKDSADDYDHVCDYGCGAVLEDCADYDCDHECDICYLSLTDCKDDNNNHICDICNTKISSCKDNNKDHYCDTCGVQNSHCIDIDNDHICNWCDAKLSDCADYDCDHECDICYLSLTDCKDDNNNHICDICNTKISSCKDNNKDHYCDTCGVQNSHCMDIDNDHICNWCEAKLSDCADDNKDHNCDLCGEAISQCDDANSDHLCDICKDRFTSCVDDDCDHECDICYLSLTDCKDDNNNHICDICNTKISSCKDNNKDHNCDICGIPNSHCIDIDNDHICNWCGNDGMGACEDSADDYDHVCDYGCGAVLEDCADYDCDHECDICYLSLTDCKDDNNNHICDICNTKISSCKDNNKDHNCDICGIPNSHCMDINSDHDCDWCGKEDVTDCVGGNPVVENNVDPDCINSGSYDSVTYCTICNEEISRENIPVEALGHNFENHECTRCGSKGEAMVDGEYFLDFEDALDHVAANGGELVLLQNVNLTSPLEVDHDLTIDGNNSFEISGGIVVNAGVTITIKNVTISSVAGIVRSGSSLAIALDITESGATVNIDNAVLEGNVAIRVSAADVTVNITDSTIMGYNIASNAKGVIEINSTNAALNIDADSAVKAMAGKQYIIAANDSATGTAYIAAALTLVENEILSIDPSKVIVSLSKDHQTILAQRGYVSQVLDGDPNMIKVVDKTDYYIGSNGNWWIGDIDTEIASTGANGESITMTGYTKTSEGLVDTYKINFSDGSFVEIEVVNAKSIVSIEKTGTEGLVDTFTITYNDGSKTTFTVTNGTPGADGREVEFRVNSGYIQWKYDTEDDSKWRNLVELSTLVGDKGEDGEDGKDGEDGITPQLRINTETNEWEISYDDGATWTSLGIKATGSAGSDAIAPQLRINTESNEWEISYDDGATWTSLGIKATGSAGSDAVAPQLRINPETNEWEVSYDNGETWTSLGVKATGDKGDTGADGNDNNKIVIICIGIAALCIIVTIVAVSTRRFRRPWWILC